MTEQRAVAADATAQERDNAHPPPIPPTATRYEHLTTVDGLEVVFVPGERLPEWAAAAIQERDRSLKEAGRKPAKRRSRTTT